MITTAALFHAFDILHKSHEVINLPRVQTCTGSLSQGNHPVRHPGIQPLQRNHFSWPPQWGTGGEGTFPQGHTEFKYCLDTPRPKATKHFLNLHKQALTQLHLLLCLCSQKCDHLISCQLKYVSEICMGLICMTSQLVLLEICSHQNNRSFLTDQTLRTQHYQKTTPHRVDTV